MYLINLVKGWFHEETPEERRQRALHEFRESLCFLMAPHYKPSIWDMSDADLYKWLELYPPGTGTKAQPVNYVQNYVEVKPADEIPKEEAKPVTLTPGLVASLLEQYPMTEEELMDINSKVKDNLPKLMNLLKLMAHTYKSDDEILAEYDAYVRQYGYLLK